MLYLDFDWDIDKDGIILDKEINLQKLGWKQGNYFKLVECSEGRVKLAKLDELQEFIIKGVTNDRHS
jgi:hypothetical protein